MQSFEDYMRNHEYTGRLTAAVVYAVAAAIALNFFWTNGHIYSSGITGLSQLVNTLFERLLGFDLPVYILLVLLNIPLLFFSYRNIGAKFTIFTAIAIVMASMAMRFIAGPVVPWTKDPLMDAIFGGLINGFGTGFALRNGLSTGGLDVIGIVLKRKYGINMGKANLMFNFFILLGSGFLFGPKYALYTAIGLVVNARMIDTVYTRQQKMQLMVITEMPQEVAMALQSQLRRGITIVHHAEGAYNHHPKEILFTVISLYEEVDAYAAIHQADPGAWASMWRIERTFGRFYEPRL
ncbi:YitT family protein [Weissella diestrammenae]|uniref:YitT family protein n=1 Tax=Weissella diestrammenae TaxID=1162633 RepID=A0A7G9T5Y3_9LACO|nr:YitT family protein [Weissella diestrammenae]MCM0582340.1 YitT family protein [Weissella diestrammenae]QNN75508.1 YitT family protein [Weissella diestrammenae]